ncbi:hypothetical protein NECAME_01884 [Necator americanus]|uniref:Uncharacterized protein n=1 Tax=Necator americanus TaxID=51031 RepID=W2TN42_NECAM|nr:hypothetical protein NECAME_01884 [Necator americanus]ETN83084.1 hypothetical protein NECAME_01884 [Necator americanus]
MVWSCLAARGKFCCQNRSEARRFRREVNDLLAGLCEVGYDRCAFRRLMQWIEPNGRQEAERRTLQQRGTNARKKKKTESETFDEGKGKSLTVINHKEAEN